MGDIGFPDRSQVESVLARGYDIVGRPGNGDASCNLEARQLIVVVGEAGLPDWPPGRAQRAFCQSPTSITMRRHGVKAALAVGLRG